MERRKHPRIAVNLNAAIVNDQSLPIGCRVKDVSVSGMMLRHEANDNVIPLRNTDNLEVRVSLKQDDERKVIHLPVMVAREDAECIGARFPKPHPELLELVKPYRIDSGNDADARLDVPILTEGTVDSPVDEVESVVPKKPHLPGSSFWTVTTGIALLVLIVGSLILTHLTIDQLANQVSLLETSVAENEAESLEIPLAERMAIRQLDRINRQLQYLTVQNRALESRIISLEEDLGSGESSVKSLTPPATVISERNWIINLLTLYNETAAMDFASRARDLGIRADANLEMINNDRVWRVQVSGFSTRETATEYSRSAEKLLGLERVWIFEDRP